MNCADLETLLCDYVDGTLAADARTSVENHLAGCASCAELVRDASSAVAFMERAADVEPPAELLNKIIFQLPSARHAASRRKGLGSLLRHWVQPVLQPRFAMGMAMTILSFSMLARFAGFTPRKLTMDDLNPAKVWRSLDDKAHRSWERTVKFYESLRVVYEIQTRVREFTGDDGQQKNQAAPAEERTAPPSSQRPAEKQDPGAAKK